MIKKTALILCVLSCLLFCGCQQQPETVTVSFTSMDTYITLTADETMQNALNEAKVQIEQLSDICDRRNPDSALAGINREGGGNAPQQLLKLCEHAEQYAQMTNGAFNPCLGQVIDLWHIGQKPFKKPKNKKLQTAVEHSAYTNLSVSKSKIILEGGATLDLGGIAKGYASDIAADLLRKRGAKSAMLSLGGNVALIGTKADGSAWRVAVADPDSPDNAIGILTLTDCFAVTSGDYQRYSEIDGKRYCHIFDCYGNPVDNRLRSVTVVCDSGTRADAYSTALFVMGLRGAKRFYEINGDFEAVYVTDDGRVIVTPGLDGQFTLNSKDYTYEIQKS